MKTKKTKTKVSSKRKKSKHFAPHYLAAALIALILIEGALLTTTQPTDWASGFRLLDVSSGITEVSKDFTTSVEPMTEMVSNVNLFYQLSAANMAELLDFSSTETFQEVSMVVSGVFEFYEEATGQMIALLDFSELSDWPARVAGVSIER